MRDQKKFKRNMRFSLGFFVALYAMLMIYLAYSILTYGAKWYATPYNPRLIAAAEAKNAGVITDRKGTKLAWSTENTRHYSQDKIMRRAVCHVVGDIYGKSLGAETVFARYLYGSEKSILARVLELLHGKEDPGQIALTIDADLSKYIYKKMDGRNGSVVVLNYQTGEILASDSLPTFDAEALAKEEPEDSSLVDRATMGLYPPGSLFKLVTASAAIEEGLENFTCTCQGETTIEGARVACANETAHGEMTLEKAMVKSCNIYFGKLALQLGEERLTQQAEKMGFNTTFSFADLNVSPSQFDASGDAGSLAWAGIGQHKDLVTPMHVAMMVGAIANDGVMMEPKLLASAKYSEMTSYTLRSKKYQRVLSEETTDVLQQLMKEVVNRGTGRNAALSGIQVYGKTGTADFMEGGKKKNHSWFAGFLKDEKHPYVVVVLLEGAGSGAKHAAPLAKEIFSYLLKQG